MNLCGRGERSGAGRVAGLEQTTPRIVRLPAPLERARLAVQDMRRGRAGRAPRLPRLALSPTGEARSRGLAKILRSA